MQTRVGIIFFSLLVSQRFAQNNAKQYLVIIPDNP